MQLFAAIQDETPTFALFQSLPISVVGGLWCITWQGVQCLLFAFLDPLRSFVAPSVRHGHAQVKELHEPGGWVRVPLFAPGGTGAAVIAADAAGGAEGPVLRAHFLQICVVAMHQNGRDTHIRQVSTCAADSSGSISSPGYLCNQRCPFLRRLFLRWGCSVLLSGGWSRNSILYGFTNHEKYTDTRWIQTPNDDIWNRICHWCGVVNAQVKVFGPRLASVQHDPSLLEFISPEFETFACIR